MKKFMSVLLACVLLFSVSMTGAQAEGIYYGIVNGGNANRVNLRAISRWAYTIPARRWCAWGTQAMAGRRCMWAHSLAT